MTSRAIEALQADRDVLVETCAGFGDAEWKADSGCAGWSVKDVVAHVGALFQLVVDPSALPDAEGLPVERAQDRYVEARRCWSAEQTLADYAAVSVEALERLAGFEGQDFELPLGDLGTYPASLLPNAFSFDHYTHIRADLFAPRGPLQTAPPPSDELRLAPALDWVQAALPQQNADVLDALPGAVEIELHGPGRRAVRIGSGPVAASITSDTASFVLWVTRRATWEATGVVADGDDAALATARRLHVF